jgi:hypothetical protein
MDDTLSGPVDRFIDLLGPELVRISEEVAPAAAKHGEDDVAIEAFNMVCAFVDADGLHTDEELWALLTTFGPRFQSLLAFATPGDVRKARLVEGRKEWLSAPSQLFGVLAADDKRAGRNNAWRYYELAMAIGHAVCALDAHPSRDELVALEGFRGRLLRTMELEGVAAPQPTRAAGGTPAAAKETEGTPAAAAAEALPPPRPLAELLAELDALVGLAPVKAEVKLVANLIQVQNLRKERGLPVADSSHHLVFTGNPGTGKTTVARLLAQIYRTLGVSKKGHLVETDRSGMVAGYVGQTAIQVKEIIGKALGGVLLIDEAYALARGDERDFGQEAIDTLVKNLEDHRDDLVVIAAGYPEEMEEFVESNPGLRSRFPKTIHFPDYSTDELVAIFESMAKTASYRVTPEAKTKVRALLDAEPRTKGFGNARCARNFFEASVARQASRIVEVKDPSNDQLLDLLPEDIG